MYKCQLNLPLIILRVTFLLKHQCFFQQNVNEIKSNIKISAQQKSPTTTESNIANLLTTAKLPAVNEILQSSIAAAIKEETLKTTPTTPTTTEQILTLDIDPEVHI